MARYALICGSPDSEDAEKKISRVYDSLVSQGWTEREITMFPDGVNELMLEYVLNNCVSQKAEEVLLCFCSDLAEIRKDVIEHYKKILNLQVVFERECEK